MPDTQFRQKDLKNLPKKQIQNLKTHKKEENTDGARNSKNSTSRSSRVLQN